MPIVVACPKCARKLRVPEDLIGKKVKCPGCKETFTAEDPNAEPDFEVVENEPAPQRPVKRSSKSEDDEDSFTEEPRRARRRQRDEEDEERYADDEEEDERPRRRRKRRSYSPHRGGLILTLGILSLCVCGLLGPIAWIMGNSDLREMDARRMDPAGQGMTKAGKICGMIATILIIVTCVFYAVFFAVMGLATKR